MAAESPWTLTIPSDLRLLALARSFVEGMCRVAGFDERATRAIVMATDEATNNVIRHAHRDHPEASLQIECLFVNEGIEVRLLDEGAPFDISSVPHLDPGELRVGGRGVFLMRALMDELSCQPRGERGNLLRMVKRCHRPVAAADIASPTTVPPLPRT
jgi:serine/threonine-protein kinase RsbW